MSEPLIRLRKAPVKTPEMFILNTKKKKKNLSRETYVAKRVQAEEGNEQR